MPAGMTLCRERHFPKDKGDFSLYFLAHLEPGTKVGIMAQCLYDCAMGVRAWGCQTALPLDLSNVHSTPRPSGAH